MKTPKFKVGDKVIFNAPERVTDCQADLQAARNQGDISAGCADAIERAIIERRPFTITRVSEIFGDTIYEAKTGRYESPFSFWETDFKLA